jgi:transcriptional regulator with XRE-family HTH domain
MVREYYGAPRIETRTLSQNELARRAGLDPSYISRLERGVRTDSRAESSTPSVFLVQHLAAAMELGDTERAALLVAAGYWRWPDLDQDTVDFVLAAALAIVAGDYRRVVPP